LAIEAMNELWYAGYASNLNLARLGKYLGLSPDLAQFPEHRWLIGQGLLYFAGTSLKWEGSVAFLDPAGEELVVFRVYRLSARQFAAIWAGENGKAPLPIEDDEMSIRLQRLEVGDSLSLEIEGKYNRAVCVERRRRGGAFALTTSKHLEPGRPTHDYASTIRQGLADAPLTAQFTDRYLERLFARTGVG